MPHEYPLPSCTFSARHLRVTVIFGRGFQVVLLHSTSVFLACLSPFHFAITSFISSMSSNFLDSSHCLRIQLLHPQRAFIPSPPFSSSPRPRHMNAPCRAFSARHLRVTVNFGRGLQVVLLHSVTLLVSVPLTSVFHASSAACHLAITSSSNIPVTTCGSSLSHPHRASGQPPLVVFQERPCCSRVCVWNF